MGHYDEFYERDAKERRPQLEARAEGLASKLGVKVLQDQVQNWSPIGVCSVCAHAVYHLPNWGCPAESCPHKPPR